MLFGPGVIVEAVINTISETIIDVSKVTFLPYT